eukprot:6686046-Prymnesium_polylepis.1
MASLRDSSRSRLRSTIGFLERWPHSWPAQSVELLMQHDFRSYFSRMVLGMYPMSGRAEGM